MKIPIWSTLCTVFFCYYFLSFKENVYKVYYDTSMHYYAFNETIKITICSPLHLWDGQCTRGRKIEEKIHDFDCQLLKKLPLECLTKEFRHKKTSEIIRTIRKCNPDDIFGTKLRLVMYRKEMGNTEDIEINQNILKTFHYDYNITYLNNGDYCSTFVFSNFTKDPDSHKSSFKRKIYYQISIESVNSPIKIYVNQQKTNKTYFNFHQIYFRNLDDDFWRQKNEDLKYEDPDFLGGLEIKNLTDDTEDTNDYLFENTTPNIALDNQLNKSSNSLHKNSTTSKQIQVARKYVPKQVGIYIN